MSDNAEEGQKCEFILDTKDGPLACAFGAEPSELIEHEGVWVCQFHLPLNAKKAWGDREHQRFNQALINLVHQKKVMNHPLNAAGVIIPSDFCYENTTGGAFSRVDLRRAHCVGNFELAFGSVHQVWASGLTCDADFSLSGTVQNAIDLSPIHVQGATQITFGNEKPCNLAGSKFGGATSIGNSYSELVLTGVEACSDLKIIGASGRLDLSELVVNGGFDLSGAVIERDLEANDAKFFRGANFRNTRFGNYCAFRRVVFKKHVSFRCDTSGSPYAFGRAYFSKAQFEATVSFVNRLFSNNTDFSHAKFAKAPEFFGCKFHESVLLPDLDNFCSANGPKDAECYRDLRHKMSQISNRKAEGMFFVLEQRSERPSKVFSKDWFRKGNILSFLYDKSSVYGTRIVRPFIILFMLFLVATLFNTWLLNPYLDRSAAIDYDAINAAAQISLRQLTKPFYGLGMSDADIATQLGVQMSASKAWAFRLGSSVYSLANIALFAIAILAIRWRFRRQ